MYANFIQFFIPFRLFRNLYCISIRNKNIIVNKPANPFCHFKNLISILSLLPCIFTVYPEFFQKPLKFYLSEYMIKLILQQRGKFMIVRKPLILYYDNGQEEKRKTLEKAALHLGIGFIPVTGAHFLQTVGHLAKVKGFPARKIPPFENSPEITKDVLVMCNFTEEKLDMLLEAMKNGVIPQVALKAVLTAQNCFWTFAQLFQELEEEHLQFYSEEPTGQ